jgi:hypothetical protein
VCSSDLGMGLSISTMLKVFGEETKSDRKVQASCYRCSLL